MSRETRHILRVVSTKEKETFAQWADSQTARTQHTMLLKGWVPWLASLTSALAWVLLDEGRVIIWWRCVWGSSNLQKLWAFFSFFFFGGGRGMPPLPADSLECKLLCSEKVLAMLIAAEVSLFNSEWWHGWQPGTKDWSCAECGPDWELWEAILLHADSSPSCKEHDW